MDPNKLSHVVKIGKGIKKELAQHFVEFLSLNQDVFVWTHTDMVGIHPKVMCHWLLEGSLCGIIYAINLGG